MRPVVRQTLSEQIVGELRTAIMSGELAPGNAVIESELALRFGVSRGPLREALRALIDEGLLVTKAYTGTKVAELSLKDIDQIFSLRTELEIFAFRLVWDRRDTVYRDELTRRHEALLTSVSAGDGETSIVREMDLHSHVYESSGHDLLLDIWQGLRGKLQLYWAAHHRAHGRRGPLSSGHESYVAHALGEDLDAMVEEVRAHMANGFKKTRSFLAKRDKQAPIPAAKDG